MTHQEMYEIIEKEANYDDTDASGLVSAGSADETEVSIRTTVMSRGWGCNQGDVSILPLRATRRGPRVRLVGFRGPHYPRRDMCGPGSGVQYDEVMYASYDDVLIAIIAAYHRQPVMDASAIIDLVRELAMDPEARCAW